MARTNVREAIVDAALRLSADKGFDAISTAEVCRAAGVSNGSMFHQFPTRDALAAALYLRVLEDYQTAVLAALPRARTARGGIRAFVLAHVEWVLANAAEARLLHEMRHADGTGSVADDIRERNRAFVARVAEWVTARVGAVPFELFAALVFGAVQMITRDWLRTGDERRLRALASDVAETVWLGLAARAEKKGERHR